MSIPKGFPGLTRVQAARAAEAARVQRLADEAAKITEKEKAIHQKIALATAHNEKTQREFQELIRKYTPAQSVEPPKVPPGWDEKDYREFADLSSNKVRSPEDNARITDLMRKYNTDYVKTKEFLDNNPIPKAEAPKFVPRITEQMKYDALKEQHRLDPNSVSIHQLNEQGEKAHFEREKAEQTAFNARKADEALNTIERPTRIGLHEEAKKAGKEQEFLEQKALKSRPWLQNLKESSPEEYQKELANAVADEKFDSAKDIQEEAQHKTRLTDEATAKTTEADNEKKFTENYDTGNAIYDTQPQWMVGPTGVLLNTIKRARAEGKKPYVAYEGVRSAGLTPLQEIAAEKSYQNLDNPELKKLFTHAQQNLVEGTNTPAYEAMTPYKNQYEEEVMNGIQRRMTEHYKNAILPGIEANFINRGAWDSSGRQNAVNRATEEHMRGMGEALGEIGHRGHQSAIQNAQEDMKRKIAGGAELKDLKSAETKDRMGNVSELERLGSRAQLIKQENLNRKYEDWTKEMEHPYKMFERENAAVRGLQVPSSVYETRYNAPQPNAATQIGGGLLETFANMQRNKNAAGGRIRLAGGGLAMPSAMLPEEQDYQNRLQLATNKMEQSSGNPMWSMLAGVGRGIATSQHANPMRAIAEAIPQGNQAYRDHQDADETRRTQALNLRKMIAESRRVQEDRVFEHKLKLEELGLQRLKITGENADKKRIHTQISQDQSTMYAKVGDQHIESMPITTDAEGAPDIAGTRRRLLEKVSGGEVSNEMPSASPKAASANTTGQTPIPENFYASPGTQAVPIPAPKQNSAGITMSNTHGMPVPIAKEIAKAEIGEHFEMKKDARKHREELEKAIDGAPETLNRIELLRKMQKHMVTGFGSDVAVTASKIGTLFGGKGEWAQAREQFDPIVKKEVLPLLAALYPASDPDRDYIESTYAQAKNEPGANEAILNMAESKIKQGLHKHDAHEKWMQLHNGRDDGFTSAWNNYAKANPVLKHENNGVSINNKNIDNWDKEIFGSKDTTISIPSYKSAKDIPPAERQAAIAKLMAARGQ
jgi:hypothetical protein